MSSDQSHHQASVLKAGACPCPDEVAERRSHRQASVCDDQPYTSHTSHALHSRLLQFNEFLGSEVSCICSTPLIGCPSWSRRPANHFVVGPRISCFGRQASRYVTTQSGPQRMPLTLSMSAPEGVQADLGRHSTLVCTPFDPAVKTTEENSAPDAPFNVEKGAPHIVAACCFNYAEIQADVGAPVLWFAEQGIRCLIASTD